MGLYNDYVEWLARKVIIPVVNSKAVNNIAEKIVELNEAIAEKTGYDYLQNKIEKEEKNQR